MVAILKIINGNFQKGFNISLLTPDIHLDNKLLPKNQKIQGLYEIWKLFYQPLMGQPKGQLIDIQETNISANEDNFSCKQAKEELEKEMQDWLKSAEENWQEIREKLIIFLKSNHQDKRLIIQTDDPFLWKLPWSVWDILEDNKIEPTFCSLNITFPPPRPRKFLKRKVRVLLVMGDNHGLNLTKDKEIWGKFSKEIELVTLDLVQEKTNAKHKLLELLRDKQGWDIFFFTGHGKTDNNEGIIHLNETESLTVNEFEKNLENAIEKGLQLAYFSACESLGLAPSLANLQIPAMIVMREKVEDKVSQVFLKNFLSEYQDGHSLETAFKTAKISLESFLPGTIFIPSLWVNPHYKFPHWQELKTGLPPLSLKRELTITGFITLLILIFRFLGLLQPLELWVFDNLVRLRPTELPDERILLVEVTNNDLKKYGFPLSDETILNLFKTINQYQPSTIGLDIWRDQPIGKGRDELISYLQKNQHIILVCVVPSAEISEGIAPPKGLENAQIGFADGVIDDPNQSKIVRRHLISMGKIPSTSCQADYALSFKLAYQYLKLNNPEIELNFITSKYWKLGNLDLKALNKSDGFYHNQIDLDGFQLLLNYRLTKKSLKKVADSVTLSDVLDHKISPESFKNKIILIGVTDPIEKDDTVTPYHEVIRGLHLHAHRVSQLVSAVEDERNLLTFLPLYGDILLLVLVATIGLINIYIFRSALGNLIICVSIILTGWAFLLTTGIIFPVIPACFILMINGTIFLFFHSQFNFRKLK